MEHPVEGTNFSPTHKNVFTPEERLKVICDDNYWIVNPAKTEVETTCNNLGEWTIRPACRGKIKTNLKKLRSAADCVVCIWPIKPS